MARIATIGFFDGVHRGHQYLFEQLCAEAANRGLTPLIVTFDRHPRSVLESDYMPRLLTTTDERMQLLQTYAPVLSLPFADIHSLTAAEFMTYLRDRHDVTALMMGYDHRFGSDRMSRWQDYRRVGEKIGMEVLTNGEWTSDEWHVSSTEIRQALEHGNIVLATEMLGRPYTLSGCVVRGKGIGRTIGFPTANIQPDCAEKIVPRAGVYRVKAIGENLEADGICNIGTNPTVGDNEQTIELHIPAYQGDLYGQHLTIRFDRFVREERKFDSLEQLRQQIADDLAAL